MTTHHPPHDHPDFPAYLDTLTDQDLTAINASQPDPGTEPTETDNS